MSETKISHARAGSGKDWLAGRWTVRAKVAAVLAVPLTAAIVLGGLAVSDSLRDADRLGDTAGGMRFVPAVHAVTAANTAVAFGQSAGTVKDEELASLAKAIGDAEAVATAGPVPGGRGPYEDFLKQARVTLSAGKQRPVALADARTRTTQLSAAGLAITEAALTPATAATVLARKAELVDAMNAGAALYPQGLSLVSLLRQDAGAAMQATAALSTERQLLEMLARHYSPADPVISGLRAANDFRARAISNPGVRANPQELLGSYAESSAAYTKLADSSAQAMASAARDDAAAARTAAIRNCVIAVLALALALGLAVFASRSLVLPLRRLREAAREAADDGLPTAVERIMSGTASDEQLVMPMPVGSDDEVGQLARAVDSMQDQALRLAADQAQLRRQVNGMFETLARRNKSLVDHQLLLIENLEQNEKDPVLLDGLFRLDNLAARMRRNGENLLILAGTQAQRTRSGPVEIPDVLRAAISEVEEYERVKFGGTPRRAVAAAAATDIAHLIAELLDNALRASPPETDVRFTFAQANDEGLLIEVADRGIGIPAAQMEEINAALRAEPVVSSSTARHMGLFVVGKLAARHGLAVWMRPTFRVARDPGVTVTLHIPRRLLVDMAAGPVPLPAGPPRAALAGPPPVVTPMPGGSLLVNVAAPGHAGPPRAPEPGPLPTRVPAAQFSAPIPVTEPPVSTPPRSWPAVVTGTAEAGDRAVDLPQPGPDSLFAPVAQPAAHPAPGQSPREVRPDLGRAATFFSARRRNAPPPPRPAETPGAPPIYAEMMSAWLSEPAAGQKSFASPADVGWAAAGGVQRPAAAPNMAGLPRRVPGERLVPGRIDQGGNAVGGRLDPAARPDTARHRGGAHDGHASGVQTGIREERDGRGRG